MEEKVRESEREDVVGAVASGVEDAVGNERCGSVVISLFNDSAEEFISTMETISSLCGSQDKHEAFDEGETRRWSSMVTFLKEWRYFCYEPKVVNFTYGAESLQVNEEIKGINLPQFSSAAVPEREQSCGVRGTRNSKDFVLHAGGSVWALDWCPKLHEVLDCPIKCEYLAVAAHPPDSSYHKIGTPLTGRGIVQIWCLLNMNGRDELHSECPRERPRKGSGSRGSLGGSNVKSKSCPPRSRGRPRKGPPISESLQDANDLKGPDSRGSLGGSNVKSKSCPPRPRGRPRKRPLISESLPDANVLLNSPPPKKRGRPRKLPIASEDLTVIDNIPPPKRPRGRPRKNPDKKEATHDMDIGKELSTLKLIPALVVDDTHFKNKSPPRHPIERPGKTPDEMENVDDLHAIKDLRNTEIISYTTLTAFDDSNAKSTFVPRKRRGRPRKKPDMLEHAEVKVVEDVSIVELSRNHSVENFNFETKLSPSRQPKGRPRRKPDKIVSADNQHIVQNLSTTELASAQSINDLNLTNVDDLHMVQDASTTTCVPAPSINDSDIINKSSLPKRCRGRPKKGLDKTLRDIDGQKLEFSLQKGSHDVNYIAVPSMVKQDDLRKGVHALPRMDSTANASNDVIQGVFLPRTVNDNTVIHPNFPTRDMESVGGHIQDAVNSSHDVAQKRLLDDNVVNLSLQKLVALPRVVLCLGHNGKVAWDVKWRPQSINNLKLKHRMGYLAVLLGNGSLEVWDVPCPSMVNNLYKSSSKESTDPRFLKIRPVFRCSKLKFAERQSIPLTMEWSKSAPYDLILVGCHDGTVALLKFSAEDSPQDSRPLLCFTADDVPIRAVAWAPSQSDTESTNLIVTAGHEGLKFWDIRDPYRPLWDFNPAQRIILSLDWLQHPSCLIFSLDNGTIKTLSLSKAAYDTPVTGKPFDGSRHGVVHNYYRSQFAIWSVQVSPITGIAAYCCADGSTLCFQLTARSVDKEKSRYRPLHFLCGAFMEVENSLKIDTPMPHTCVAELPRPVRGLPSHSNCALAEYPQVQDDYPAENSGHRDSEPSASRKKTSRTSKSEKFLDENQNVDPLGTVEEEEEDDLRTKVINTRPSKENFLVLPPKLVAMHRVRWNINKGSERWLCYGGAAGIIRCQEISLP